MNGLVHIYEGDGKGKTSAAVGLSIRCAGSGQKVLFTQFLKDNRSSELNILEQIENIDWLNPQKSFGFVFMMTPEQKKEAQIFYQTHFHQIVATVKKGNYRMLVLDEVIATYNHGLIEQQELVEFIKQKPRELEIVMTGRDPAEELVELADYVSKIEKVKHPFDQGVEARIGIEQ
jgi:cob(I)alamin adenosyltransferase